MRRDIVTGRFDELYMADDLSQSKSKRNLLVAIEYTTRAVRWEHKLSAMYPNKFDHLK